MSPDGRDSVSRTKSNGVYGATLARSYIEIHHIKSIRETEGIVTPATDLVPLCSNCHSRVHRHRWQIIAVEELQEIIRQAVASRAG